jgi:hypothetical protein
VGVFRIPPVVVGLGAMTIGKGAGIALCLGVLALSGPGDAQEANYVAAKPVGRQAIVVGNADYTTAARLPGTIADAQKIRDILTKANFDVTFVSNVKTRADFLAVYFLPFLDKIHPDDFVVFYFSGHGFNYGGENYLVPLQFQTPVMDSQIFSTFMSVRALQSQMSARKPGVVVMFLDACRDITSFLKVDKADSQSSDEIAKALSGVQPEAGNVVIGFSSDAGKTSMGSDLPDQLSAYTAALAKFVPEEGKEFDTVRKDVREEVLFKTNEQQTPWFSESSSSEIYFAPSELILGQELDLWKQVLLSKDRREVLRFLRRHSVSRYAAAARRWLNDHPDQVASFTRISPIGPEVAWSYYKSQQGGVGAFDKPSGDVVTAAKVRNFSGPFAFDRVARLGNVAKGGELLAADEVIEAQAANQLTDAETLADVFAKQGEAVAAAQVVGRAQPSDRAKAVTVIGVGTRLRILGFETDSSGTLWVKALVPKLDGPVFVAIPSSTKSGTTNIGKPLLELKVAGPDGGLVSSVNEKPILDAVEKIRAAKLSVLWVSIATPDTDDPRMTDIFGERATYLIRILNRVGISSLQISTVEKATDLQGKYLRVRIFGN